MTAAVALAAVADPMVGCQTERVGGDLRHHRVGAGAGVVRGGVAARTASSSSTIDISELPINRSILTSGQNASRRQSVKGYLAPEQYFRKSHLGARFLLAVHDSPNFQR